MYIHKYVYLYIYIWKNCYIYVYKYIHFFNGKLSAPIMDRWQVSIALSWNFDKLIRAPLSSKPPVAGLLLCRVRDIMEGWGHDDKIKVATRLITCRSVWIFLIPYHACHPNSKKKFPFYFFLFVHKSPQISIC